MGLELLLKMPVDWIPDKATDVESGHPVSGGKHYTNCEGGSHFGNSYHSWDRVDKRLMRNLLLVSD